jgi:hypothetical protein
MLSIALLSSLFTAACLALAACLLYALSRKRRQQTQPTTSFTRFDGTSASALAGAGIAPLSSLNADLAGSDRL